MMMPRLQVACRLPIDSYAVYRRSCLIADRAGAAPIIEHNHLRLPLLKETRTMV
jgi:hypothetical protein